MFQCHQYSACFIQHVNRVGIAGGLGGGWTPSPVHVYRRSFLSENRFKISIPVQNFKHFDIWLPSSFRSIPTLHVNVIYEGWWWWHLCTHPGVYCSPKVEGHCKNFFFRQSCAPSLWNRFRRRQCLWRMYGASWWAWRHLLNGCGSESNISQLAANKSPLSC